MGIADLFMYYLQGGLVDVALLGGAQIDRFGNLNSTVIGDYAHPRTRLPGSGGACEIAINARRIFVIMRLKKRAFVEQLDFVTSPGYLDGSVSRQELNMPGLGPSLVITDRALFGFDAERGEMSLVEMAEGETVESIQAEVGWPLLVSSELKRMTPPTAEELQIVREQLDPAGLYR
jgi:glutaconate CoA-transferase subunit B